MESINARKNVGISSKKYYREINIARGIGMILVVLGHQFPDASTGEIKNLMAKIIFDVIYSFHMPLFIFISGFLACKILKTERGLRKKYLFARAKRTLIPYFAVGFLYLPLKMILSKFANKAYDIKLLWQIVIGNNPNYALWTLWVLFVCAAITIFFVNENNIKTTAMISVIVSTVCWLLPMSMVGVKQILVYYCYYIIGILIVTRYDKIKTLLKNKLILLFMAIIFIVFNSCMLILELNGVPNSGILMPLTSYSGIYLVMYLGDKISRAQQQSMVYNIFNTIGTYSMDIYILSTIIQPFLRIVFYNYLKLNYWIYTFAGVITTILLAIVCSKWIVRKSKILRTCLLGLD